MKRALLLAIAMTILFIPATVKAATQALDLIDTLESVDITPSVEDYKETDDQVIVYMFRGATCQYCHQELEFLNENLEEYGLKFKLRSYEVTNEDNDKLKTKIANFFGDKADGVPYTIVGDSTFYGYNADIGEKILKAIESEYRKETKYDLFAELEKAKEEAGANNKVVIILLGFVLIAVIGGLIIFARKEA